MSEKNGYNTGEKAINAMEEHIKLNKELRNSEKLMSFTRIVCYNSKHPEDIIINQFISLKTRYTSARDAAINFGQDITKFPRRLR